MKLGDLSGRSREGLLGRRSQQAAWRKGCLFWASKDWEAVNVESMGRCPQESWPRKPANSPTGTCHECHSPVYPSKRAPRPSSAIGSHLLGTHPAPAGTQASVHTDSGQAWWAGPWLRPSQVPRGSPAPLLPRPLANPSSRKAPGSANGSNGPRHWGNHRSLGWALPLATR